MPDADRLERLTDLVLVLVNATRPLTLDAIANEVPGYPEDGETRRQAFERDKRLLRDEGIPVLTEPVEGEAQFGYRIDPAHFYLPDLDLEPDEQAALHLAVAGVHLGDPSGRQALLKLGATGLAEARPVASLVPPPALVPLFDALRAGAEVRFGYRGERRLVAPASLAFRRGRWYLVGWDLQRQSGRTFRVDRVEGSPEAGPPGSAEVPEGFDAEAAVPDEPWRLPEDDEAAVTVRVDAVEGPRVAEEVGDAAVLRRDERGAVDIRLRVTSPSAFRSWMLGLLHHAVVLHPPSVRQAMIDWLEAVVAAGRAGRDASTPDHAVSGAPAHAVDGPGGLAGGEGATGDGGRPADRRRPSPPTAPPRVDAATRLRRLLAIVGWLARVGEAPISEIARRFGIAEDEVVRELELAACCGLPPYSPDVLMDIVVTDDAVQTYLPPQMGRPRRLTPAEGFALVAAARTILAVPGADTDGTLARALAKLEAAMGSSPPLRVELERPDLLELVRRAADEGTPLEITYLSASSDELTTRVVDPLQVFTLDGHWYLDADCHRAGDVRRFRVDRIRSASAVDEGRRAAAGGERDRRPLPAAPEPFVPGPDALRVRLVVSPPARWVADSVPVLRQQALPDGSTEIELAVAGQAWLERLLLQVGPDARVIEPPELRDVAASAARRVLDRYRSPTE